LANSSGPSASRIIIGVILVVVGLLFIFDNYDIFSFRFPVELINWQNILIAIGVLLLFSSRNKGSGFLLILIGFIGHYPDLWPLILIGLGIYIMLRSRTPENKNITDSAGKMISNEDLIDEFNLFGGSEKIINSSNFRGGKITSIFGGTDLNLQNSRLAEGENALDVFVLFGGVDLRMPNNWIIKNNVTTILGGFSDKRVIPQNEVEEESKVLRLKGTIIFGGGEIK